MERYYTYRLYPSESQQQALTCVFGCSRYVYNKGLQIKLKGYTSGTSVNWQDISKNITSIRKDSPWLAECPSQVLQMALKELDSDCTTFIKGGQCPNYKKKSYSQSVRFPQGVIIKFKSNAVKLPKIGSIPVVYDRKFSGVIKMVTVYRTSTDKYYVKITVTSTIGKYNKPCTEKGTIGISTGINTMYALSTGQRISKPVAISKTEGRLKIERRKLKDKVPGSVRYKKQVHTIYRVKEHLKNQERDYLQKISSKMIKEYDTIIIEDSPGKLVEYLTYKCQWYGNNIVRIGTCKPCPDICNSCGHTSKGKGVGWKCEQCGTVHNRNHNNALNIKLLGQRKLPSSTIAG